MRGQIRHCKETNRNSVIITNVNTNSENTKITNLNSENSACVAKGGKCRMRRQRKRKLSVNDLSNNYES